MKLKLKGTYKFKYPDRSEILVYVGKENYWYQFTTKEDPYEVWCEALEDELYLLDEIL